ncbi:MAG: hypothetical protein KC560_17830 [Myxococcales bacterium]|nr:hypothetical protein [Myxococcales bacterium]
MHIDNYSLRYSQGVELLAEGHNWDLHNFAVFVGCHHDPVGRTCSFTWVALLVENPWGDPGNTARGCILEFSGVSAFVHEPGIGADKETLSEISDIPQGEEGWSERDAFDLWLRFEDGTVYKLRAERSRLLAVK